MAVQSSMAVSPSDINPVADTSSPFLAIRCQYQAVLAEAATSTGGSSTIT